MQEPGGAPRSSLNSPNAIDQLTELKLQLELVELAQSQMRSDFLCACCWKRGGAAKMEQTGSVAKETVAQLRSRKQQQNELVQGGGERANERASGEHKSQSRQVRGRGSNHAASGGGAVRHKGSRSRGRANSTPLLLEVAAGESVCVVSKASLELLSRGVQLSVTGTKHSDMVFRKKDLSVHMQDNFWSMLQHKHVFPSWVMRVGADMCKGKMPVMLDPSDFTAFSCSKGSGTFAFTVQLGARAQGVFEYTGRLSRRRLLKRLGKMVAVSPQTRFTIVVEIPASATPEGSPQRMPLFALHTTPKQMASHFIKPARHQ